MTELPPSPPPSRGFLPPTGAQPQWVEPGGASGGAHSAYALPAASWGSRAGALILDVLVMVALALAVGLLVTAITGGDSFGFELEDDEGVTTTESLPYGVAWGLGALFFIALTYPWLMLGIMRGRTPGRRLVGIRVVNYDGTPLTTGRAFLREGIAKGVLSFFTLPLLLSYLWPLWDPHQRALHDLIVSTRVVRDDGDTTTDAFGSFAGGAFTAPTPTAPTPRPGDDEDLAGRIGLEG